MENVWILLAIFVVLMMMHVPIAVAMGLSSLIGFMMIGYNLTTVGSLLYTAVASTSIHGDGSILRNWRPIVTEKMAAAMNQLSQNIGQMHF